MIGKIYVNLKHVNMLLIKKFGKMPVFLPKQQTRGDVEGK